MLKINMLGGVSHLPFFAPDDDKKSTVEDERKKVEEQNKEVKEEVKEPEEKEEVVETKEPETKEEVIEAKEDEIDELKEDKKEAKTQADKDRIQRRIDRITGERNELRKENEKLRSQLAAKPDDEKILTEDEVETRAGLKAQQLRLQQQFEDDCQNLANEGKKLDKKFNDKIDLMAEEVGKIPSQMIGILADLPNGGAVLLTLANDLDLAEETYKLNTAKMAVKLARISDKIIEEGKKQISKAPAPKDKVDGKGATPETRASEKDDMDAFVRKRNIEAENHRRRKLGMAPLAVH